MGNNKIVAVTGGIGSGKSTVLDIFKRKGYPVLDADAVYAELLSDEKFVERVSLSVGVEPQRTPNGLKLDREAVRERVFADESLRERLNNSTHSAIMDELLRRAQSFDKTVFCEIPLLFEGGFERLFDLIVVVKRKTENRVAAVEIRDGKSRETVEKIIKTQYDYSKIVEDGHTLIVENDGDESALKKNIEDLLVKTGI